MSDSQKRVLNTLVADAEYIGERIEQMHDLFKAIQYTVAEGGLTQGEINNCMSAYEYILEQVADDVENSYVMSETFREEAYA